MLGPIRAAWTSQDWLRHLATPDAFYARFVSISEAADGRAEVHESCLQAFSQSLTWLCSAKGSRSSGQRMTQECCFVSIASIKKQSLSGRPSRVKLVCRPGGRRHRAASAVPRHPSAGAHAAVPRAASWRAAGGAPHIAAPAMDAPSAPAGLLLTPLPHTAFRQARRYAWGQFTGLGFCGGILETGMRSRHHIKLRVVRPFLRLRAAGHCLS